MEIPNYLCERFYKLNPRLRLAWCGVPHEGYEDEKGAVLLLDLNRAREWEHNRSGMSIYDDMWKGWIGKVYGRKFDLMSRIPVAIWMGPYVELSSGRLYEKCCGWHKKTVIERYNASQKIKGDALVKACNEAGGKLGEEYHWGLTHRNDVDIVPKCALTKSDKHFLSGEENYTTFDSRRFSNVID